MSDDLTFAPNFVNVPSAAVRDLALSDVHFRTLAFFHGLAWRTKGERTPPLTIEDLIRLRGLSRSKTFEHLKVLKAGGFIRTEYIGNGLFVVYLLRQEPGAALPMDERTGLTDEELAILADGGCEPPSGDGAIASPENGTPSPENGTHHDVVVLNHDPDAKQQQHDLSPENGTQPGDAALLDDLVDVLVENGLDEPAAQAMALDWLNSAGPEVCARQLDAFERRCELARASKRGLQNPIGLLCASIRGDWPLPPEEPEHERWFTDEEFEQCFHHPDSVLAGESPPAADRDSQWDKTWQAALNELQLQMTKATFDTWVRHTRVADYTAGALSIAVQNDYARDWLENRLKATVLRTVRGILGYDGEQPPPTLPADRRVDTVQFQVVAFEVRS